MVRRGRLGWCMRGFFYVVTAYISTCVIRSFILMSTRGLTSVDEVDKHFTQFRLDVLPHGFCGPRRADWNLALGIHGLTTQWNDLY